MDSNTYNETKTTDVEVLNSTFHALLDRLPPNRKWTAEQRDNWLNLTKDVISANVSLVTEVVEHEPRQRVAQVAQPAIEQPQQRKRVGRPRKNSPLIQTQSTA